jgi:probable F420-dependent oxidoreductase
VSRLGLGLSFATAFTPEELVGVMKEAERRGYHTAWVSEVTGPDAFVLLTLIASQTATLRVSTGVVPVQTRTPVALGLAGATLDRIAPGRVAIGLGLSSPVVVGDWHGAPFSPKVSQLREAVAIIRQVMSGERVTFEGKHYRVRGFRMSGAVPSPPVKVYLSALGPRALELAGEIADGVLLNWIAPERVPESIRRLEAGARRAGRTLADFEIAGFVRTCVTDDATPVRRALAREITGYAIVESYASFFRTSGFAAEIDALVAAWQAGDRAGAVKQISERMLDALGVVGPEDACRARMAEFTRAGLTMPVVMPFAPEAGNGGDVRASVLRTVRTFP